MNHKIAAPVLLLVLFAGALPAKAADKEQRQMMADIRMLQEQQQQIQNAVLALTEALKTVDTRLSKAIVDQSDATRKALADEKLAVDTISHDLRTVREGIDDGNVRIGTISQEVDALRQLVVQQAAAPRPAAPDVAEAAAANPADVPPAAPPSAPPVTGTALGASPAKAWDQAYADYAAAQYDLAIHGFEAYIKDFPKSDMADDAQVVICNAFLNQAKYDQAVDACDTAIRMYPTGNAIPEAYYRKGLALQNLKKLDDARTAYQTVIQKYPESYAATLANQKVQELKKP
jgi:TolA-binding protein